MWKIEDRKELLTAPITLPPLDEQTLSELRQHYDEAADAETRTHFPQFFRGFRWEGISYGVGNSGYQISPKRVINPHIFGHHCLQSRLSISTKLAVN